MNKGVGIFLLLCMTLPMLISHPWLVYRKNETRKEVKRRIIGNLPREMLSLLTFTRSEAVRELRWKEPGEFEYRHQMYDIIRMDTSGPIHRYLCYPDRKETALNKKIRELVAAATGTSPQNRNQQKQLINFFQSLFVTDHLSWEPLKPVEVCAFHSLNYFRWPSVGTEPPEPPPRLSLSS